jgi:Flp pilus assembly protein TadD
MQNRFSRWVYLLGMLGLGLAVGGQVSRTAAGHSRASAPSIESEAAYRANNLGVALLEQYRFADGAEALTRAVALDARLAVARINLAIALLYVPDLAGAEAAARVACELAPEAPQPLYVRGLVARAENRPEDAMALFEKVLSMDPSDIGALLNRGQILMQMRRYGDATASFERILALEPFNATATYNLGVALNRSGKRDEGMAVMARFQKLRESPSRTELGQSYREQGRYAEAVVSTGSEPGLVEPGVPEVSFEDATRELLGVARVPGRASAARDLAAPRAVRSGGSVDLADLDGDGDLDLLESGGEALRFLRADGGRLTDGTSSAGLDGEKAASSLVGDLDGDGRADIVALRQGTARVLASGEGGRFRPAGGPFPLGSTALGAAALVDADHDGDLDILLGSLGGDGTEGTEALRLLRNDGRGAFTDVTSEAHLGAVKGSVVAIVPTDFDNRRDVDILVVFLDRAPALLKNMRDGTFKDVGTEVGLPRDGGFVAVSAGDVNKDDFTDFVFARRGGPVQLALSDARGGFSVARGPAGSEGAESALFLDYDLDGLLDLLVRRPERLALFRNVGSGGWIDVSAKAFARAGDSSGAAGMVVGDVDGDGDGDLVLGRPGAVRILRNVGGNRNRSAVVRLAGLASNRSGVGAKVEVRAGSLRQKAESYVTWPAVAPADIVFGLGGREGVDAVRILWPSGILQTETESGRPLGRPPGTLAFAIKEVDRKPSSCPYLYAWNGSRFEFVTDFLGAGEMGYFVSPGVWSVPDPEESVRLAPDQLRPKDGRFELRVTNELEECLFLDHVELHAITHPEDVEVFPNEGMTSPPRARRFFAVRDARPPRRAVEDSGRDVTDRIARLDRRYADGFARHAIRGYAAEHALTIDLGPCPDRGAVLLLSGWTDYAFSSDNLAASQAGVALQAPLLQARDATGSWTTVVEQVGVPVGRPQTIVLDLSGKWPGPSREVRILTNMRIYWDQIRVGSLDDRLKLRTTRLRQRGATLRERGFSAEISARPPEALTFDYAQVRPTSQWKAMTGRYTREGDVRTLLAGADDLFVVSRPGDEVALSFDATALGPLPRGWSRTYAFEGDGFSKEMDINSASPDAVLPLPFHGMRRYPYPPEDAPARARAAAARAATYNTRVVTQQILPLEASVGWLPGRPTGRDDAAAPGAGAGR